MAQLPSTHCGNKPKDIPDIWECRYFVRDSKRPPGFEHKHLKKIFDKWDGPFNEKDLYFITDDKTVNVKLRKSSKAKPTIKVRVLQDKHDEFELWRTEIDQILPAPAKVWSKVLTRLNIKGNVDLLSNCSKSRQVKKELLTAQPNLLHMEIRKKRWRYFGPQGEMEVAEINIKSPRSRFWSVSFESKSENPGEVRAIRDKFPVVKNENWTLKNYVTKLSEIQLEKSLF